MKELDRNITVRSFTLGLIPEEECDLMSVYRLLEIYEPNTMSSVFRDKMVRCGLLNFEEEVTYEGVSDFSITLTEEGKKYGKDIPISNEEPQETKPLFYKSKFPELLELLKKVKLKGE